MRVGVVVAQLVLAAALVVGASGCGDDSDAAPGSAGTTLTVYSSLPFTGPNAGAAQAVVDGEKLALYEAGGKAGDFIVKYVSLDDSTAGSKGWDPRQSAKNARTAVQDRTTIAYLGDFDTGATAITLPTLNEADLLQITPATTLVGLTRAEGGDKGEPEKYYPSGMRTFGRVIPADNVQAAAQITLQKAQGCRSTALLHDDEAYGKSLADLIELLAVKQGLKTGKSEEVDLGQDDASDLVKELTSAGDDCVFLGSNDVTGTVKLLTQLQAGIPGVHVFLPHALATDELAAALPPALAKVTELTSPGLPSRLLPAKGRAFLKTYRRRFHAGHDMYALYGYEAMGTALQAIRDAGAKGNDKGAVTKAFFAIRDRRGALGTFSINADGDTSLSGYGVYRVAGGKLRFQRLIGPAPR